MYKSKYGVSALISGTDSRAKTVAVTVQRRKYRPHWVEAVTEADAQAGAERVVVVVAIEVMVWMVTALESVEALWAFLAAQDIAVVELVMSSRTNFLVTDKSRPCGLPKIWLKYYINPQSQRNKTTSRNKLIPVFKSSNNEFILRVRFKKSRRS